MSNVVFVYPADKFVNVVAEAAKEVEVGLIIGYDKDGHMVIFGGGLLDKKRPMAKDWLWLVETFKSNLINGEYSTETGK